MTNRKTAGVNCPNFPHNAGAECPYCDGQKSDYQVFVNSRPVGIFSAKSKNDAIDKFSASRSLSRFSAVAPYNITASLCSTNLREDSTCEQSC